MAAVPSVPPESRTRPIVRHQSPAAAADRGVLPVRAQRRAGVDPVAEKGVSLEAGMTRLVTFG
jgi:hypothetical protein